MINSACPLTRKLSAFVALSDTDLAVLDELHRRRRKFPAGRELMYEGQRGQAAYILAAGWALSYKLLPGGTRQIVDFQIPGDFAGPAVRVVSHLGSSHRTCDGG